MLSASSSCFRIVSARARPRPSQSCLRSRAFTTKKDAEASGALRENPFAVKAQARAKQMHSEIEGIVKKHDQTRAQEAAKAKKPAGFTDFLGKNKTNISVIIVSFLTLLLSVKMVQNKQKYTELEIELKESESQLEEKRELLKSVTSDAFLSKVAQNYANNTHQASSNKTASGRSWGFTSANGGGSSSNKNGTGGSTDELVKCLKRDLHALIGDAALSEDEKNAKDLEELRVQGKDQDEADILKLSALSEKSGANEGTEQWVENVDGKKTVKKSVFVI